MIGLVYCAKAGLERLCKMELSHHKQSHFAHSTLKLSYITIAEWRKKTQRESSQLNAQLKQLRKESQYVFQAFFSQLLKLCDDLPCI